MVVEPEWLRQNLDDPNVIVLDASYPKVTGEKSEHQDLQIIGALRFDIDYFSDQDSNLPHMLSPAAEFQEKARALGLNRTSHLVIYDNFGIYSAPRAWWMFKAMGHDHVSVLNGGLPGWIENAFEVEAVGVQREFEMGDFTTELQPQFVKSFQEISENLSKREFQVVDARSAGRFAGTASEPRPELSSGHIPDSANIPFPDVLLGTHFKDKQELRRIFRNVDQETPLVFSCGSGLTACILLMAAQQVLENPMSVYDGSWTEWAASGGKIEND